MVVGEGVQRGPPRNRSPLAVSFPHFFSAKRNGVARRRNALVLFPPRRSGQNPRLRHCEAGAHTGCGNPLSPPPPQRERPRPRHCEAGEHTGCGNPFTRPDAAGNPPPLYVFAARLCDSFLCSVASGGPISLPPKKSAKETARGNLFRGGSLWTPSPTTKGAAAPIGFPVGFTGDEGREFHSLESSLDNDPRCFR